MNSQKVPNTQKFGLLLGSGGITSIFSLMTMLAMIFYTDIMGLSPAVVGTMILVAKVWDAINDPLCGMLIDRTHTRFGQAKPFLFFGGIGIFVFGVLMFVVPGFSSAGKLVWSYITYNGVNMAFTACVISMATLIPRITKNQLERVSLSAFSFIGQTIFAIAASAVIMPMITHFSQTEPINAYWKTALVIGAVGLVFTMFFVFIVKENHLEQAENKAESRKKRIPLLTSLKSVVQNKPFLLVALVCLINGIAIGVHNSSLAQYLIFGLKKPELASMLMPVIYVGALAAGILAKPLARFDKVKMCKIAFLIIIAGILVRFITRDAFLPLMIGGELAVGIGSGLFNVYVIAMLFDCAEFGYNKTKVRNDGLIISSMTFQLKIGQGLGGALLGFWLEFGGYVGGAEVQSDSAVSALFNSHLLPFLIVAAISFVLLYFYKLNDKRMETIVQENEILREAETKSESEPS
jgi:GPH family glycoside/pentoside/hexuronide:cation symporter